MLFSYFKQWIIHRQLIGRGVKVHPSSIIKGKCDISKGVIIGRNTIIEGSWLDGRGGLIIGDNCIINSALIITAQHDIDSPIYPTIYSSVVIHDFVLVYRNAIILPGRSLGMGSVVAAGAVVTRDVPEMAVVAGNPAKVIRYRRNIHSECDVRAIGGAVFCKKLRLLKRRISNYFIQ